MTDEEIQKKEEGQEPEETESAIKKAEKLRDELKAENDRKEQLINREEELKASNVLDGKAEAGSEEKKKEETPAEYRQRIDAEVAAGKYD